MAELITMGSLSPREGPQELLPGRRKVLALLAYLIRQEAPVPRDLLAQTFWAGSSDARGRHSLRQAISELRATLGEGLEIGAAHIAVRPGSVDLDVTAFARDIEAEQWEAGLARWRGEFLPGLEDLDGRLWRSWLDGERIRLSLLRARALAALRPGLGGMEIDSTIFRPAAFIELARQNLTRLTEKSLYFVEILQALSGIR